MTRLLKATDITKNYGRRTVVKGISVEVRSGETVGLLGPNGAGKTTTFYVIAGLLRPEGGRIELDGEDIGLLPMYQRARRGISYLPQEPSIFRKLTVRENLRSVLEITNGRDKAAIEERVETLLAKFNLGNFAER